MRAVALGEDRKLSVVEVPAVPVGEGQVELEIAYCGICGSDLHAPGSPAVSVGHILGHEVSGRITAVGPNVEEYVIGDRVTMNPFKPCGECRLCTSGLRHLCFTNGTVGGFGFRPGGYAESTTAWASMLHRLPDEVSDRDGALAEPLAVGVHAVGVGGTQAGEAVCILGGGPIGVMCAIALRARGVDRIVVVEPAQVRRELVAGLGFDVLDGNAVETRVPEVLGTAPSAIYDATGHVSAAATAVGLIAPRGTIVIVGVATESSPVPTSVVSIKEAVIKGAVAYSDDDIRMAIELLAKGKVPTDGLVTRIAPLEETQDCFEDLLSGRTTQLKVLLEP